MKELLISLHCQQNTVPFKKVYENSSENITTLDSHDTTKTHKALEHQLKGVKQHIKQREIRMINPQKAHFAHQALIWVGGVERLLKTHFRTAGGETITII